MYLLTTAIYKVETCSYEYAPTPPQKKDPALVISPEALSKPFRACL